MFCRCSSRVCNEWNGFHQPYNIPPSSVDVERAEIDRALTSIKAETEEFERNQQYKNSDTNRNYENNQITTKFQPVRDIEYASNYPLYEGNYSMTDSYTRKKNRPKS